MSLEPKTCQNQLGAENETDSDMVVCMVSENTSAERTSAETM